MYPGPTGSPENHRKGFCSDGVRQKVKSADEVLPIWPQPSGIFTNGSHFHPMKFLSFIWEVYEKVLANEDGERGGAYSMEEEAFTHLLTQRVQMLPCGMVLFKLFDLILVDVPDGLIVEQEGGKFLRIDCLQ